MSDDVRRLAAAARATASPTDLEELWSLCSSTSLPICAAAGHAAVSLLAMGTAAATTGASVSEKEVSEKESKSEMSSALLSSLLRQARLRASELPWACTTQLARTICRVACSPAAAISVSSLTGATLKESASNHNHPVEELLRCHGDLWAPVISELSDRIVSPLSQTSRRSNSTHDGANTNHTDLADIAWRAIRPWATSVLLLQSSGGNNGASVAPLKTALIDMLVRVAWEAITVRSSGTNTGLDMAIVEWLLKSLRGAPRAHPSDAMLLRKSLHHCADLLLDETFGGNTAEASACWESLRSGRF